MQSLGLTELPDSRVPQVPSSATILNGDRGLVLLRDGGRVERLEGLSRVAQHAPEDAHTANTCSRSTSRALALAGGTTEKALESCSLEISGASIDPDLDHSAGLQLVTRSTAG